MREKINELWRNWGRIFKRDEGKSERVYSKSIWSRFSVLLFPTSQIGGLEITDSVINFYDLSRSNIPAASLRLPPGIVEDGKVKQGQEANFTEALRVIHSQITADSKKIINVILTLPGNDVYAQSFNVSKAAESNLAEAAELNLRMISPMPVEGAYYGWQRIADIGGPGGVIELLGAFVPSESINSIIVALRETNFGVAAVEFSALSLVRQLVSLKKIDKTLSYLVMHVTAEGLDFIVIKNNSVYFNYFYPWKLVQADERNITLTNMEIVVDNEVARIFNFYLGRSGSQLKDMIIVTPSLGEEITQAVTKKFPDMKISSIPSEEVAAVAGAALRGLIARAEDTDISLTGESAVKIFEEQEVLEFTYLWRKVAITVMSFILLVFSVGDIYISRLADKIAITAASTENTQTETPELAALRAQAADFNKVVDLVKSAQELDVRIAPFLNYLGQLAGANISFSRLTVQSLSSPVLILGTAPDENSVLDFKKRLDDQSQFTNVSVPLSSIAMKPDGKVFFQATFLVGNLNFPEKVLQAEIQLKEENKKNETTLGQQLVDVSQSLQQQKPEVKSPLIIFGKLTFKSVNDIVSLDVSALDEDTANLFRSKLDQSPNFDQVQIIPPVIKTEDGRVKFTIQFFVKL